MAGFEFEPTPTGRATALETWTLIHVEGGFLHVCIHAPLGPARETGVVMAPAFGRERLRAYRELVTLARDLASQGYSVIRFDYRGEGESSGSFEQATVTSRAEDILSAARILGVKTGVGRLCLFAARAGALAGAAALGSGSFDQVILWDPIYNGRAYGRQLMRSHMLSHEQYFGVKKTSSQVVEQLQKGSSISVFGFRLALPLYEELLEWSVEPLMEGFDGVSTVLHSSAGSSRPGREARSWHAALSDRGPAELTAVKHAFKWGSRKEWKPDLDELKAAVASWLSSAPAREQRT